MNGEFGYIKAKYLTEKHSKRASMDEIDFGTNKPNIENSVEVTNAVIKDENLENFASRKKQVEKIISDVVSKEKYTVNINLKDVNVEAKKLERFIIELMPRLREIGTSICITNNNILSNEFLAENNIQRWGGKINGKWKTRSR